LSRKRKRERERDNDEARRSAALVIMEEELKQMDI
jgi:hypothetical protein